MHTGVPQYIDVEDKIAFGLTAKQLLWMGGMVAALIVAYSLFDRQLFFIVAFFLVAIFGALAFWRPQGVSLLTYSSFVLQYLLRPRNYIWKRTYSASKASVKKTVVSQQKQAGQISKKKRMPSRGQLQKIAWVLDTEGKVRK